MTLADADKAILELHEKRLDKMAEDIKSRFDKLEDKLNVPLGELVKLATVHQPEAAHNHTPANCPLAKDVKDLERSSNRAKGAIGIILIVSIPAIAKGLEWLFEIIRGT